MSALVSFSQTTDVNPTNNLNPSVAELKKFSLQELVEMEITSVSKKPEKLSEAAAAIHVITAETFVGLAPSTFRKRCEWRPGFDVGTD